MKKRTIPTIILALVCLTAALQVYAAGWGYHGHSLGQMVVEEIPKQLAKGWMVWASRDLYNFLTRFFENLPVYVLANPDIEDIKATQGFFIRLIQPIFVGVILLTAGYGILYSESARGRGRAKGAFVRLFFTMILITLSPYISWFLISLSEYLTGAILKMVEASSVESIIKVGTGYMFYDFAILTLIHRTGGVEVLLLWETFLLIINFTLAVRYLLVTLWHTLLPISLLFFAFTPLKKIGKKFLHQTLLWTFFQVGWAIGMLGIAVSVPALEHVAPDYPVAKIGVGCLLILLTAPRMVIGLMDWLSLGIEVIEIVNAAPLSVGALTLDEMKVERGVVIEEPSLEGV